MKKYQLFFNQLKKAKLFFSLMLISVFSVISLPGQAQEINADDVKEIQQLAEEGYPRAQFALGNMYDQGLGVKQDYTQAVKWYRKAAEQGDADAQNNLGVSYARGEGVKKNLTQAKKWFKKACDNGDQDGCKNLKLLK